MALHRQQQQTYQQQTQTLCLFLFAALLLLTCNYGSVEATDYSVTFLFNSSADSLNLYPNSNPTLVKSSSTGSVEVVGAAYTSLASQFALALGVLDSQVGGISMGEEDGGLTVNADFQDLNSDPNVAFQNLSTLNVSMNNNNVNLNITTKYITPVNQSDPTVTILAVIFSIFGAAVLVFIAWWIRRHQNRAIISDTPQTTKTTTEVTQIDMVAISR